MTDERHIEHKVSYPIAQHPGCSDASLQAMSTADSPLCAFISAYAAYYTNPNSLRGTLGGDAEQSLAWIKEQVAHFQVPLGRAAAWARAVNLQRAEFNDEDFTEAIGGLTVDPYQILACRHATVAGLGAALGCGLGKTLTTAALARAVVRRRYARSSRLWVFCPLNAFGAWDRFRGDLETLFGEVRILSNDSAHKYMGVTRADGGVVVFDEAHEMGDRTSRRTKAAHQIRPAFDFCICLTGTLTHAGIEKCLSVCDLIVPGLALFASRWRAGDYFKCLVKKQLSPTHSVTALVKPSGESRERFLEWLGRGIISLTKHSPEVQASVQIPEQHLHDIAFDEPWPDLTDEIVRIAEQILADEGELPHMQRVVHILCRQGAESKVDWLLDQIDTPDVGVVVFAHYRETLDYVQTRLNDAGIRCVRVDGDVAQADRPALQKQFQDGEVQVFLGQTKAAGIAIDLFRAQVSVMLDHSWKAIDYAQALARTCRRGQDHACYHFDLYANSFQKKIIERIRDAADFDAQVAEYQAVKRALTTVGIADGDAEYSYGRSDTQIMLDKHLKGKP